MSVLSPIVPGKSFRLDLSARGYQVLFHIDEVNRCPGCGHTQWFVGRITAECVICATALPLAEAELAGLNPAGHVPAGHRAVALHVVEGAGQRPRRDKRRHARTPADGRVISLHLDGSPHAFALQNISDGGLMGPALPGITEAASLMVELEDGTMLAAGLKWTDGEAAGLAFLMPAKPKKAAKAAKA